MCYALVTVMRRRSHNAENLRIVLHIGMPKTGSTSLQQTLSAARNTLLTQGVLYPRIFRSIQHSALLPLFHDERDTIKGAGPRKQREAEAALASVARQVAAARPDVLVLSAEGFSNIDPGFALSDHLERLFGPRSISAVCYLRHPVRLHQSKLSQRLARTSEIRLPESFNMARHLEPWSRAADLMLREYAPSRGWDVVSDFVDAALPGVPLLERAPVAANQALSAEGADVMMRYRRNSPHRDANWFKRHMVDVGQRLRDIERSLPAGVETTPMQLKPWVQEAVLACARDDVRALDRDFGFRFSDSALYGMSDARRDAGIAAVKTLSPHDEVADVVEVTRSVADEIERRLMASLPPAEAPALPKRLWRALPESVKAPLWRVLKRRG